MRYLVHAGSSQEEIDASESFAHLHATIEDHAKELCSQYSIPGFVPMSQNVSGTGRLTNALHKYKAWEHSHWQGRGPKHLREAVAIIILQ